MLSSLFLEAHLGASGQITSYNKESVNDIKIFRINDKQYTVDEVMQLLKNYLLWKH